MDKKRVDSITFDLVESVKDFAEELKKVIVEQNNLKKRINKSESSLSEKNKND